MARQLLKRIYPCEDLSLKNKPRVYVVGAFRFPDGDAAAVRVLGLGKSLRESGFEVLFSGWEEEGRSQDFLVTGEFVFQDFKYYSQNEFRTKKVNFLRRLWGYLSAGKNTIKWLKTRYFKQGDVILAYPGGSIFLLRLYWLSKIRRVKLLVDCTEWYDPNSLVGGRFGLVRIDSEIHMRFVNKLIGNVIVISKFLERYYRSKHCRVLRIPPTIDLSEEKWNVSNSDKSNSDFLHLVYAGIPAKKDLIFPVILAIESLRKTGKFIRLNLIGPSRTEILGGFRKQFPELDINLDSIVFHGRIPQAEVPSRLVHFDFSVLLRPDIRSSHAGFSTKLVESLAVGVPVIVNDVGDTSDYISEGREGFVLRGTDVESVSEVLERIYRMRRSDIDSMKRYARERAERSFAYRNYSDLIADFIKR